MSLEIDKWTGDETVAVKDVIALLNEMVRLDPVFTKEIMSTRFPCNHEIRDHSSIQVHAYGDASSEKPKAGLLGILNGILGIDRNHFGAISAIYEDDGSLTGFTLTDTDKMTKVIEEREAKKKVETEEKIDNRFDNIRKDSDSKEVEDG